MPKLLTISICTHNRVALLTKCLNALSNQTASNQDYDVMIIDNGSTDDTLKISFHYCELHPNFKYFHEPNVGLSNARNRALRECHTDFIGYVDDDAHVFANYVEQAIAIIRNNDFSIFGGGQIPVFNNEPPSWFDMDDGYNYPSIEILQGKFLCGYNIIFNRELLNKIGGFNTRIGMSGKKIAYGEETLAQLLIQKNGGKLAYVPDLIVTHLIDDYKLTLTWQFTSKYSAGRDYWITFNKKVSFRDRIYLLRRAHSDLIMTLLKIVSVEKKKKAIVKIFGDYFHVLGKALGHAQQDV